VHIEQRVAPFEDTKIYSPRTVTLTAEVMRVFTEALANPMRPAGTELVFFGEPGRDRIHRPYLLDIASTDAKRASCFENFRSHNLRHEAVSRFVEGGLSDQQVSAISGHRLMQMLKRYASAGRRLNAETGQPHAARAVHF